MRRVEASVKMVEQSKLDITQTFKLNAYIINVCNELMNHFATLAPGVSCVR